MKKNVKPLAISGALFLASAIYMIVYQLSLKEIVAATFNATYNEILMFAAKPIFYFTLAYLIVTFILSWAGKPIDKKAKTVCLIVSILLEVIFFAIVIIQAVNPITFGATALAVWLFIIQHSIVHMIPGAIFAIGLFKN